VGELDLGQAVEVRNQPIQFGAQAGAFDGVSSAFVVRFQANLFGQIVKFGRGAGETGGAADDGGKPWVALG